MRLSINRMFHIYEKHNQSNKFIFAIYILPFYFIFTYMLKYVVGPANMIGLGFGPCKKKWNIL